MWQSPNNFRVHILVSGKSRIYQNKGLCEAGLSMGPIFVKPMAKCFTKWKDLSQFFLNKISCALKSCEVFGKD